MGNVQRLQYYKLLQREHIGDTSIAKHVTEVRQEISQILNRGKAFLED